MTVLSNLANFRLPDVELVDDSTFRTTYSSVIEAFIPHYLNKNRVYAAISVAPTQAISKGNEEIINLIKSFKFLEENWDEENAKAISPISIRYASEIVRRFNFLNEDVYLASPGPNEEILLIIKNNSKELELIVYPNKMKFVKFENNEFVSQGDFSLEELPTLNSWAKGD